MKIKNKILITKNPNGDTRTANPNVSYTEFQKANDMHMQDVYNVMHILSIMLEEQGKRHDFTKKSEEELFYSNFLDTLKDGTDFVSNDWYQMHVNTERHHLLSRCPEDVNLLDVIEMIVDCVCAGLSRSGEVRDLEISDEILNKAVTNTTKLIQDNVVVK